MDLSVYSGAKPEKERRFPSLISYIREKNDAFYNLLITTGTLSYLENNGGWRGMTLLMPSKAHIDSTLSLFENWDYEEAMPRIKALFVRAYLPNAAAWEEQKADIPNALGKKVVVEAIATGKAPQVTLKGGAVLTLNKEYVPISSKTAIWDMDGEYDFQSAPESEAIKYRPKKGGAMQSGEPDVFNCRKMLYQQCIELYLNHLKDSKQQNPFIIMMGSAIEFFTEHISELRSAYGGHVDPMQVLGCIKSYSPEAFFLTLVEPGRRNVTNPVLPDSLFCRWLSRAWYVNRPVKVIMDEMTAQCKGDGAICTNLGEVAQARKKFAKELLRSMTSNTSSADLKQHVVKFAKENKIGQLANVEPSSAHEYLYGNQPFRKAYWDQTLYECSYMLPIHEEEARSSRSAEANEALAHVRYFLEGQMGTRACCSYEKGTSILNDDRWKGYIPQVNNFYTGPIGEIRTGCFLYEALTPTMVQNNGEFDKSGLENPLERSPVNLENRCMKRLQSVGDYPIKKLSPSEAEHVRLVRVAED